MRLPGFVAQFSLPPLRGEYQLRASIRRSSGDQIIPSYCVDYGGVICCYTDDGSQWVCAYRV